MSEPRNGPYIWITWLSKVMAGEQSCEWASWFKAHNTYVKLPGDFDLTAWTIEHTKRLRELRIERQRKGEQTSIEAENSIRLTKQSGVTIAGKPDLIALTASGATIYDVKTGQPKTSDTIQVMIYMHLVPMAVEKYKNIPCSGCVVYGNNRVSIPPKAIDDKFRQNLEYFLEIVGGGEPPAKAPSQNECRFCDIPQSDCPERYGSVESKRESSDQRDKRVVARVR